MSGAVILPSVRPRITSGPATTTWYATGWPRFFSGRMTRPQLRSVMANAVPAETSLSSSIAGAAVRSACSASASIDGLNESFVCSRSTNAQRRQALGFKIYRLGKIGEDGSQFLFGQAEANVRGGDRIGAVGSELGEVVLQSSAVGLGERAAGQPQLISRREDADDLVAGRPCASAIRDLWFVARLAAADLDVFDSDSGQ